ncbi:MAG: efflux RND transporter periplasmic adaptor subunit [Pseudomonadales bacterium]
MSFVRHHPILFGFVILAMSIFGLTAYTYIQNQQREDQGAWGDNQTPIVITKPAEIRPLVDEIESIGTAKANESVSLAAKVTDTVSDVHFEDGALVEKGDILLELTNSEERAMLAEAKTTLDEATRQYNRLQNLIDRNLASEQQLDEAKARVETAQSRFDAIVARLDDRLIRAPFSGVLGFRNVSPGTLVSQNTVVTTLDDIRTIKLDFSISERYLSSVKPGQEVIAKSTAWPEESFTGKVQTVGSRVDPVTRSVSVRARIDNEELMLRPGMLLTIRLVQSRTNALVIPEEAIIPIQDKHYVYRVGEDHTARRQQVEIGRQRPGIVEIISGLEEGDQVITEGVIKVRPGIKVIPKNSQAAANRQKEARHDQV